MALLTTVFLSCLVKITLKLKPYERLHHPKHKWTFPAPLLFFFYPKHVYVHIGFAFKKKTHILIKQNYKAGTGQFSWTQILLIRPAIVHNGVLRESASGDIH